MNISELHFTVNARSKGYKVLRRGWPDFALIKEDGSLFCVEVKSDGDSLSQAQKDMIEFLTQGGIPCYVSRNGEFPDLAKPEGKTPEEIDHHARLIEEEYHNRLEHLEDKLRQIRKLCDDY